MSEKSDGGERFLMILGAVGIVAVILFFSQSCGASERQYESDLRSGLDKATSGQELTDAESNAVNNFLEYETRDW